MPEKQILHRISNMMLTNCC